MQRTVPVLLAAVVLAVAVTACSGGKSSNSSSTTTTTTTTASSPGASPASSAAATSAPTGAATAAANSMAKAGGAAGGAVGNGASVYSTNCSSCHQATGKGQAGVFPPLAGNSVVTGPPAKVIAIVKNGLSGKITVGTATYNGQMPAWKGTLSNADIAHVITYIRTSWGNSASAVTESQVAAGK